LAYRKKRELAFNGGVKALSGLGSSGFKNSRSASVILFFSASSGFPLASLSTRATYWLEDLQTIDNYSAAIPLGDTSNKPTNQQFF
jgi:hypothetical protein